MWKAFAITVLLLATLVPAMAAASDICKVVCVNNCNGSNVCVLATESGTRVCAGVGFGLQGAVACGDPVTRCFLVAFGIDRESFCVPIDVAGP
jgi:hypothetical protein